MKKIIYFVVICFSILFMNLSSSAYADIGPKPSVVINFTGLEDEKYYVTLLSEIPSTGPHSALGEHPNNQRYKSEDEDYNIWQKFISYKDRDGFYFLQYFRECTETSQFTWGYYPPPKFKILIYFPDHDSFVISEEKYERYAFDSYYKVDMKGIEIQSVISSGDIKAEKSYDHTTELLSLMIRVIATIAIEVLIAVLFGFRAKKQLLIIMAVNAVTQIILNILLNYFNYKYGGMMFVMNYVWMEVLVTMIEVKVYNNLLHMFSRKEYRSKWIVPIYALAANAVSFIIGLYIAHLVPGIF